MLDELSSREYFFVCPLSKAPFYNNIKTYFNNKRFLFLCVYNIHSKYFSLISFIIIYLLQSLLHISLSLLYINTLKLLLPFSYDSSYNLFLNTIYFILLSFNWKKTWFQDKFLKFAFYSSAEKNFIHSLAYFLCVAVFKYVCLYVVVYNFSVFFFLFSEKKRATSWRNINFVKYSINLTCKPDVNKLNCISGAIVDWSSSTNTHMYTVPNAYMTGFI